MPSILEEIERHASDISIPIGINMPKRLKAAIVEVRRIQAHHWELCNLLHSTIGTLKEADLTEVADALDCEVKKLGIDLETHTHPEDCDSEFYKRVS